MRIVFWENYKEFIKNIEIILNSHQRFKSEKHDVFTTEISKIAPSANDDKKIQSINSIGTHTHGTNKDIPCKKKKRKKEIKCNNIMKQYEIYSTIYYDRKH